MTSHDVQPVPFRSRSRRATWWRAAFALFMCVAAARADVSKEYQVKAAFLYNFTKFVEWSADRFDDDSAPIRIAILGSNPFNDELEKIVHDRKVNGRAITVIHLTETDRLKGGSSSCHVVFVPAGEEAAFEQLAPSLGNSGTLTVGESARFAAHGGIVNFTTVENKVRFEINADAAERAGLKLSAQLQKLATVVRRGP